MVMPGCRLENCSTGVRVACELLQFGGEFGDEFGAEHELNLSSGNSGCKELFLASKTSCPSSTCTVMPMGRWASCSAKRVLDTGVEHFAHPLVHERAAAFGHADVHVDKGVVATEPCGHARRTAIGHGAVRGRIGEHARATGGEDLPVLLIAHGEHGVAQSAAQTAHVDAAIGRGLVEVGGVEDDEVGHGGVAFQSRVATEV